MSYYDEVQKLIWEFNTIRAEDGWLPGTDKMQNYVRALWLKKHIDEVLQSGEEIPPGLKERIGVFLSLWKDWVAVNKLIDHYKDLMREADIGRYTFTQEDVEKLRQAIERLKTELPQLTELTNELERPIDVLLSSIRQKREKSPFITENWTVEIECYFGGKADIIPVKITPFPLERAKGVYSINSWMPEKEAEYDQLAYLRAINNYVKKLEKLCPLIGPERAEKLLQSFSRRYIELYEDYLTTRSRIPAAHVVGPARMPSQEKLEKLWRTEKRKLHALDEFVKNAMKRLDKMKEELEKEREALKKGTTNVKAAGELEKLKEELAILEKRREIMKEANKIIRSKKLSREEKERKLKEIGAFKVAEEGHFFFWPEPDELGRIGFPSFELQRVGEKIRRLKARIEELEKKEEQARGTASGVKVLAEGEGWKIVANHKDDRLWVVFSSVPPYEVRRELKAHGFRWSPKRKAWVRKLTDNAIADALQIIEKTMNVPGLTKRFSEVRLNPPELKEPWKTIWENAKKAVFDGVDEVVLHETGKPTLGRWEKMKHWESETQAETTWKVNTAEGPFELTLKLTQHGGGAWLALYGKLGEKLVGEGFCDAGRGKDVRRYVSCIHSVAQEVTRKVLAELEKGGEKEKEGENVIKMGAREWRRAFEKAWEGLSPKEKNVFTALFGSIDSFLFAVENAGNDENVQPALTTILNAMKEHRLEELYRTFEQTIAENPKLPPARVVKQVLGGEFMTKGLLTFINSYRSSLRIPSDLKIALRRAGMLKEVGKVMRVQGLDVGQFINFFRWVVSSERKGLNGDIEITPEGLLWLSADKSTVLLVRANTHLMDSYRLNLVDLADVIHSDSLSEKFLKELDRANFYMLFGRDGKFLGVAIVTGGDVHVVSAEPLEFELKIPKPNLNDMSNLRIDDNDIKVITTYLRYKPAIFVSTQLGKGGKGFVADIWKTKKGYTVKEFEVGEVATPRKEALYSTALPWIAGEVMRWWQGAGGVAIYSKGWFEHTYIFPVKSYGTLGDDFMVYVVPDMTVEEFVKEQWFGKGRKVGEVELPANNAFRALIATKTAMNDEREIEFIPIGGATRVDGMNDSKVMLFVTELRRNLGKPTAVEFKPTLRVTEARKIEAIKFGSKKAYLVLPNKEVPLDYTTPYELDVSIADELRKERFMVIEGRALQELDKLLKEASKKDATVYLDFKNGDIGYEVRENELKVIHLTRGMGEKLLVGLGAQYLYPLIHEARMNGAKFVKFCGKETDYPVLVVIGFKDGSVLNVVIAPRLIEESEVYEFYKVRGRLPIGNELIREKQKIAEDLKEELIEEIKKMNDEMHRKAEEAMREAERLKAELEVLLKRSTKRDKQLWEEMTGIPLERWAEAELKDLDLTIRRAEKLKESNIEALFARSNNLTPPIKLYEQIVGSNPIETFDYVMDKLKTTLRDAILTLNTPYTDALKTFLSQPGNTITEKLYNSVMDYLRYKVPLCPRTKPYNDKWFIRCVELGHPDWWGLIRVGGYKQFWKWVGEQALKLEKELPENVGVKMIQSKLKEMKERITSSNLSEGEKNKLLRKLERLEGEFDYVVRREPERLELVYKHVVEFEEKLNKEIPETKPKETVEEEIKVPVEVHGEKTEMPLEEVAEMEEVSPEEEGLRFIRQKLRDAYVGKFLLHGFSEEEVKPPEELIDRLAREVYEGKKKQVFAMAEVLKVAERDLAEAKKERALRKLGVERKKREEKAERKPGAGEIYERLLAEVDREMQRYGVAVEELSDIEPELRALAEAVVEGMPFEEAVKRALYLARSMLPPGARPMHREAPKVRTATEVIEERRKSREEVPTHIYEYVGRVPEWLKEALKNPRELGEMLYYGVERYLREKSEVYPDAPMYVDFLAKWLSENVIHRAVQGLKRRQLEQGLTLREGLALYLLENYGGVLAREGYDAMYKRAVSWARRLVKDCKAPECRFAYDFAEKHFLCMEVGDYNNMKLSRHKIPGYSCTSGWYYLLMSALVEALKVAGGSAEDIPEPYGKAYILFTDKMLSEFQRGMGVW